MKTPIRLNSTQFIEQVVQARVEFDSLVARFSDEQMLKPGVAGQWSIKDILAHITWHENEMVGMLTSRSLVGSELWYLPLDQRNQAIYEQNKDRHLREVCKENTQVYTQLIKELEKLVDADLYDPTRFPGMPADWQPWQVIASNTTEHYQDHLSDLRAWCQKAIN